MKKVRNDIYERIIHAKNLIFELVNEHYLATDLATGIDLSDVYRKDFNLGVAIRAVLECGTFTEAWGGGYTFAMPCTSFVCYMFNKVKKEVKKGRKYNPVIEPYKFD